MHMTPCALVFALASDGNNIAARIAMIAKTTRSSINVKARVTSLDAFNWFAVAIQM
jgi:hypothetical protein